MKGKIIKNMTASPPDLSYLSDKEIEEKAEAYPYIPAYKAELERRNMKQSQDIGGTDSGDWCHNNDALSNHDFMKNDGPFI